jgi:hypothetical protein
VGKSAGRIGAGIMTGGLSEVLHYGPQDAANKQANAAQNAAMAQQRAAQANYDETASIVNPASIQALASLDRDIANQSKNLERQEKLISALDPTVIEASQQALKILRGESNGLMAPVESQRQLQRQKLLNSLREQLGPGAETSTAGIQALTRFDSETNNLLAGQRMGALGTLGQTSAQFTSQRPDMFREIMGLSSLGQNKYDVETKRAAMLGNARMGLQQTAGAEFTGDQIRGRAQQAQWQQIQNLGMTGAGFMLGGPLGGAAGSQLGGALGGGGGSAGGAQSFGSSLGVNDPSRYSLGVR